MKNVLKLITKQYLLGLKETDLRQAEKEREREREILSTSTFSKKDILGQ
jgi:hypothetical protein